MIYRYTERVDNIRKDKVKQGYNESEMYDTNLTLLTFENAATRLKDAATRLSFKLFFPCPNQLR